MRKTPSVSSEDRNGVENDENSVAIAATMPTSRNASAPPARTTRRSVDAPSEKSTPSARKTADHAMNPYVRRSGERHAASPSTASEAAPAPTTRASERP